MPLGDLHFGQVVDDESRGVVDEESVARGELVYTLHDVDEAH